jgi:hypothetical protein
MIDPKKVAELRERVSKIQPWVSNYDSSESDIGARRAIGYLTEVVQDLLILLSANAEQPQAVQTSEEPRQEVINHPMRGQERQQQKETAVKR